MANNDDLCRFVVLRNILGRAIASLGERAKDTLEKLIETISHIDCWKIHAM